MKIKSMMAVALATLMFSACSNDAEESLAGNDNANVSVAYVSINVETPKTNGRASSEQAASQEESDIKSLWAIPFDANNKVLSVPKSNPAVYAIDIYDSNNPKNPDVFKISSKAKKLMLIANPGAKMVGVINSIGAASTFSSVNAAITDAVNREGEIIDNASPVTKGFAMINADGLVDLTGKVKTGEEAQAKAAAKADKATVRIERIAAKIQFSEKTGGAEAKPAGAKFVFDKWLIDAVNETFFPLANKAELNTGHSGTEYARNFYTADPNFNGNAGIAYYTVNASTFAPDVPANAWKADKASTYCIENTMEAAAQLFENATRVVVKATYYPKAGWTGDWFQYGENQYENFDKLMEAYLIPTNTNLRNACDKFLAAVKLAKPAITVTKFENLTAADIADINHGGEVAKFTQLRWYKGGLCYYYYEIRHDNEITDLMAFGKYGVVRNNWYTLTLNSVSNPGTPWYPDVQKPGPGDPDPKDPIDETVGYLGVSVTVQPWIYWTHGVDF